MSGDGVTDVEGLRLIAWSLEGGNVKMADECRRAADEIVRLRAEVERLTADPTIYKHQCGHCSRLSPLPFLIPGYLLDGPS